MSQFSSLFNCLSESFKPEIAKAALTGLEKSHMKTTSTETLDKLLALVPLLITTSELDVIQSTAKLPHLIEFSDPQQTFLATMKVMEEFAKGGVNSIKNT
eukprot:TRINITY_DN18345_c0_g1_i1.p1 TRINITY_DN18345_c0_g1~~TRINITY_DN18345_c0_g1_i1.p1  ORF type:complete len:100 (-),score=9.46 TRINITY_DN18345_c0_g1_i1:5-304(-)